MDDLKLYANSREEMKSLLVLSSTAATEVGMSLNREKCNYSYITNGARTKPVSIDLLNGIAAVGKKGYKYLGLRQALGTADLPESKFEVLKRMESNCKAIAAMQLTAHNTVIMLNARVMGTFRYAAGGNLWKRGEIKH